MSFTAFLGAIGFKPTPAQRVYALVAIDGIEPETLSGDDRETARTLFGDVDTVPPMARDVVVLLKGARIGGSYTSALYLLWRAMTADLSRLAPGEMASALVMAPDLRLARQTLRYARGALDSMPSVASCIENDNADSFVLVRPDGRRVVIECLPATRGGTASRGRSYVGVVLSEVAFFRDADSGIVNDAEVYRSVSPRVMPGGKVILESTPWIESGLLHGLFTANHGRPTTAIAAHAPTLLMRPELANLVARERLRDAENASREFDAEFIGGGAASFFDPSLVDRCVDPSLPIVAASPRFGVPTYAGADFGFRSDSSALVILQREPLDFACVCIDELRPSKGAPLVPSTVARRFAGLVNDYGAAGLLVDGHYVETIREYTNEARLRLFQAPEGIDGKAAQYLSARDLIHGQHVRLPNHPRLLGQLKAIISKPLPGGGLRIESPRRAGAQGHGDIASALVAACWWAKREWIAVANQGKRERVLGVLNFHETGEMPPERFSFAQRVAALQAAEDAEKARRKRQHT